jgi:branched-chain amino acid aminotransferase
MTAQPTRPAFGTLLAETMGIANYRDGRWSAFEITPTAPITLSPAAHVLHYASTCFEGFKAFKHADGSVHVFRMDRHIARMQQSAERLVLPAVDPHALAEMVRAVIRRNFDHVPEAPGALYLRPILFGTTANIGAAATPPSEAMLLVLASPVWDYFTGGMKPLKILVDDQNTRSAAHLGMVKTGGNYAAAMGPTLAARAKYHVDQVLFCPGGEVQETGAANFILLGDKRVLTRSLDSTFLHGVTRDSLLTLARDLGYEVSERIFDVKELLEWSKGGEAALSGTAAVLAGVGTLVYQGKEYRVGSGEVGPIVKDLRARLVAIQNGEIPDSRGWLERINR